MSARDGTAGEAGAAAPARPRGRLAGVEGLRGLAASSILVYHVWLYGAVGTPHVDLGPATKAFDNLRAGVTLFFVLSGFLLYRPYVAAALRRGPSPSLRRYLRNRALRILPAYWVILLAVAVVLEHALLERPLQLVANALLLQNYVPGYIFGYGIVPAWSLAVEVVFYLAVPILGGAAIGLATRRGLHPVAAGLVPVAAMLATGIAAKAVLPFLHGGFAEVWAVTFLSHADWFAAGMAVAVLHARAELRPGSFVRGWRPPALALALALAAVAMKLYYEGVLSGLEYQSPIALACALLLAIVVFPAPGSRAVRLLEWGPVAAVGTASYSLFLWHDPLVRALRDAGLTLDGALGLAVNVALVGAIAGSLSALTYRFVERPALARKRTWQGSGAPPARAEEAAATEQSRPVRVPA